ncbi:hypothetical protein E1B28_007070 [Marasmius oreades]|uniref:Protein-S-isoprenylcysteine O-methyltransferase n=1 Tax=Marasmius oreades TaxID=181124 RepID=A0A9P7S0Z2_9AGAR|nr:uncharacterized protein E1B28_007070 [Marasmius oreades]KAG7093389.1 hypothetical protein E1B28_007070 [Marasmius oreades]
MTTDIVQHGLAFLKLALVVLSSLSFRKSFTPPRTPPFPAGRGWTEPQWMTIFLIRYVFPVLKIALEIASLNECLFTLCTSFPEISIPFGPHRASTSYCTHPPPNPPSNSSTIWSILSLSLVITGQHIRNACYRAFNGTFTFDLRADSAKSTPLVTHGPYSIIRHPAYAGSWLIVLGIVGFHLSSGSWIYERSSESSYPPFYMFVVGLWIMIVVAHMTMLTMHTRDEDELLRNHFGEKWEQWRRIVKYKVVLGVY